MKQSNLLNAQFARRLFGTVFSSWQLLAVMLIVCMNVAVGFELYAQSNTITVKGKVMADGEPVIGATVLVKGVSTGTATDMDGNFTLNVASKAVLVVSSIGYETQEVPVNGRTLINVVLKSDVVALKDVVVVGYGVQKKVNLTGAVSSLSTDELEGKPIANVLEAMQGTTPGLVIQQGTSTPGSVPSINIRGLNTMNNNDPLVIIDGIEGSLANLNPADIEQVSILKDASSTAIYGSRASNGVVLVTTKKGKAGKVEISYDFMYGVQQPTSLPKIADSWVYAELYNEAAVNSGRSAKFTPEQIAQYRNGGPNVNWVKELYNRNSPQSSHSVSMTGGNDQLSYMASLGYLDQSSMFKGPDYGYKRYNARLNVSHKVTNNFTLNLTSQFARNDIKEHAYWTEWIIEQANRMPPIYPIKNEDGSYNYPAGSNSNGLQRLEEGGYRQNVNDELLGTIQAEWEVYKGLKLIGSAGGRVWNNKLHENRKAFEGTGDSENKLTEQFYRSKNITTNLMVTYNTKIGKHSIGGLLGYAYEGFSEKQFSTSRLTEDSKYDIFVGDLSGDKVSNTGSASDWAIYSGFARATYNYDEKYLLEFNIRNDYSSYFAKGNRSGVFPSFSAGWRISEEKFWSVLKPYVPSLKIRGSWGLVGNNRIGAYQYMQTVSVKNGISFGDKLAQTAEFASANPDLKWETTRMANIGFELGLLNNDLNITFDCFNNRTKDILVNLPVPGLFGNGAPIQNAGKVETRGWELSVNYRLKTGPVVHNFAGNISDSFNEVIDTRGTEIIGGSDVQTIIKEGYPLYSYYAYRSDGFFQNEEECQKGPHLEGITPKPGDIRYLDKNGDGVIKPDDDRFIVGNDFPRYTFGFTYGLEYKGFDFSMMWQGVGKRNKWMRGESVEAFHNNNEGPVMDFHQDRWTPNNPDATYPRLTMGAESANNAAKSDFWIQDAKYLRLKNAQIGYTFPQQWMKKLYVKNLRIFASVQNPLTFTKMKGGWDPEYTGDGSGRAYPVARVYSFGLNVKF
ncbi:MULTISPECIES: SusC/RagA family TonB-linked outer membrane protein [Bacteroides]|jgi:TonB-linked SusC/RagA family outer membrane protein|uniref:SusC/RagA family TonB-linked outer membrane protein n=1 Tax=Bacteroides TaxID=816 RepID=UPI000E494118|nr:MULTISPECIES: TonB-dependent receptor [Bacteroides]QNL39022.1 TonB-dependent receptor [Bacteroides sp. M10]RGR02340.1 TonB-dependent receptor [Bacteroides sp. AF26-7BH]RGY33957.1 TonB-dependent receptor [Bacteroides sp. OF02-3LB]